MWYLRRKYHISFCVRLSPNHFRSSLWLNNHNLTSISLTPGHFRATLGTDRHLQPWYVISIGRYKLTNYRLPHPDEYIFTSFHELAVRRSYCIFNCFVCYWACSFTFYANLSSFRNYTSATNTSFCVQNYHPFFCDFVCNLIQIAAGISSLSSLEPV